MKTIEIKYHKAEKDLYAGQRGEHRMTRLAVPLPRARLPDIQSAVATFDCDGVPRVSNLIEHGECGDAYLRNGKAYITLTQRLTRCRILRVQLECYDAGGAFIVKSPVSERIKFEDSITDHLDELIDNGAILTTPTRCPCHPITYERALEILNTEKGD